MTTNEDRFCGFCGGRLTCLSFELLYYLKCNVMYDAHDMKICMARVASYKDRWRKVPDGVLVVLEELSREVAR